MLAKIEGYRTYITAAATSAACLAMIHYGVDPQITAAVAVAGLSSQAWFLRLAIAALSVSSNANARQVAAKLQGVESDSASHDAEPGTSQPQ